VAQRRRRLFVVGCLGDQAGAAKVLFERESVQRNPAPSREARQGAASSVGGGTYLGNAEGGALDAPYLTCSNIDSHVNNQTPLVAHTLRGVGFDAGEDGTGRGTPLVPTMFSIMPMNSGKDYKAREVQVAQPLMAGGPVGGNQGGDFVAQPGAWSQEVADPLTANEGRTYTHEGSNNFRTRNVQAVAQPAATAMQVRRLTPVECERLQGFPDGYTNIPWRKSPEAPDGPRYKALGNSMAVPCMAWIGQRIAEVDRGD